jgi:hypothetical protein
MKMLIVALALGILSTPAFSQVRIETENPNGAIRFDNDHDRYRDRDHRRGEHEFGRDYEDHGRGRECKTVIIRENGVITKTKRCR